MLFLSKIRSRDKELLKHNILMKLETLIIFILNIDEVNTFFIPIKMMYLIKNKAILIKFIRKKKLYVFVVSNMCKKNFKLNLCG